MLPGDTGSFEVGAFWPCAITTLPNKDATTAIVATIRIVLFLHVELAAVAHQNKERVVRLFLSALGSDNMRRSWRNHCGLNAINRPRAPVAFKC